MVYLHWQSLTSSASTSSSTAPSSTSERNPADGHIEGPESRSGMPALSTNVVGAGLATSSGRTIRHHGVLLGLHRQGYIQDLFAAQLFAQV